MPSNTSLPLCVGGQHMVANVPDTHTYTQDQLLFPSAIQLHEEEACAVLWAADLAAAWFQVLAVQVPSISTSSVSGVIYEDPYGTEK